MHLKAVNATPGVGLLASVRGKPTPGDPVVFLLPPGGRKKCPNISKDGPGWVKNVEVCVPLSSKREK